MKDEPRNAGPLPSYAGLVDSLTSGASIPGPPIPAIQLIRKIESGDGDLTSLAEISESDPILGPVFMRVGRQAHGGIRSDSHWQLLESLMILGQNVIRTVAVSVAAMQVMQRVMCQWCPPCMRPQFRSHGLFVGVVARQLVSRATDLRQTGEAHHAEQVFATGLLYDLWAIRLAAAAPQMFEAVWNLAESREATHATAFRLLFGRSVGGLNGSIARAMGLPDPLPYLLEAATGRLEETPSLPVACLRYADHAAWKSMRGTGLWVPSDDSEESMREVIGLDDDDVRRAVNLALPFAPSCTEAA